MVMMNETDVKLFLEGKYSECSTALRKSLEDRTNYPGCDGRILQLCMDNNLFVSDQLAQVWESSELQSLASYWEKGMLRVLDIQRSLRYQQLCSDVPKDVALCVIHNSLFWATMKVDPFLQHKSTTRECLKISLLNVNSCICAFGGFNLRGPCTNIAEEFLYVARCMIPRLQELPPDQCHLLLDVFIFAFVIILDDLSDEDLSIAEECCEIISSLTALQPQIKIHISLLKKEEKRQRIYPQLFKFGFCSEGELLDDQHIESNLSTSLDTMIFIGAVICLRLKLYENSSRYLDGLQAPKFVFLFHYLKALIELEQQHVDSCLYHISRAPIRSVGFFMQARLYTLKGQALLLANKPNEALKALDHVQFDQKEVQLPIAAFRTAQAYGELGKVKQQIEVLRLLIECLSAKPIVQPLLWSPTAGLEHRLLLLVHSQPEISYVEALYAGAAACVDIKPKEASNHLVEILRILRLKMDHVIHKIMKKSSSISGLADLLHDTACALLKAGEAKEAELLCQACLKTHQDRINFMMDQKAGLKYLEEDVIALLLLSEAQAMLDSADVFDCNNMCAKLIHNFLEQQKKKSKSNSDKDSTLAKMLLARVYLQKAQLNIKRKFSDDATACFQRAISFNRDDADVLLAFAGHLLDCGQLDESLTVWTMYTDRRIQPLPKDIALKYLLGDRMISSSKENIITRLKNLIEET